jgi:hypothetical protein
MSEDKTVKYEFDTHLPSLKKKSADVKTKGHIAQSEITFRDDFSPVLDKQNVVIRLIDHLKERF